MRVDILDPPAYSPAYDDQLAAALARAGADVRLLTSEFAYGQVPKLPGYAREERFYRHAFGSAGSRLRTLSKLAEHLPDMLAYRRSVRAGAHDHARADVAHFEWLTLPRLDLRLLPEIPTVLTIHDPLEREKCISRQILSTTALNPTRAPIAAAAFARVDALVVHTRYARERVIEMHGLDSARVHVIPHGALGVVPPGVMIRAVKYSPPRELHTQDDGTPVVLCFGLLRPYKGVETLLRAWRGITGAQLWIVGRSMMDLAPLQAHLPPGATILPRFATRNEEQALFERADMVVLPYHQSGRFGFSGVLATALGYGKAIVLSDVDGLSEVAQPDAVAAAAASEAGPAPGPAARLVPPADADALHAALAELLDDRAALDRLAAAAAHAAATTFSWDRIAGLTLDLYAKITAR